MICGAVNGRLASTSMPTRIERVDSFIVAIVSHDEYYLQPYMARARPASSSQQVDACQSCGMPLSLDKRRSASANEYCSHCWRGGRFVMPDLTVEQMQARVTSRLRQVGVPEQRVRSLVRRIPSLARWRSS
jgi:hypothetical protein